MKHKTAISALALLPALLLTCPSGAEAAPRTKKRAPAKKPTAKPLSKAAITNMPLVKVTDPKENSFSISMPKGWRNQAFLARTYELYRPVSTSLSPDGSTVMFVGDPRLPSFTLPDPQFDELRAMVPMNPLSEVSERIPAREYFDGYVREKFGQLPGFRITGITPDPAQERRITADGRKVGREYDPEAVRVAFTYRDNNKPMRAIVNGNTAQFQNIWIVGVSGVTTTGDPLLYNDLLLRVVNSHRTNQQWMQQQQQLHEQRMAILRQDYANQMASFNASNQAHQVRMNAIQDAGNANMKSWYEKQAAGDVAHRNFLNYITDEKTVVSGGKAFQVDNSHQKYFINKQNNTYIGTDRNTSLDDLRAMGIDPSNYQVAQIKR
ncbi:hypothetical protein EON80_21615 [bacterium]|nr:MAG: hypothetical protein EON80_21615 [bacterium]